jgi:hypothetical protein
MIKEQQEHIDAREALHARFVELVAAYERLDKGHKLELESDAEWTDFTRAFSKCNFALVQADFARRKVKNGV